MAQGLLTIQPKKPKKAKDGKLLAAEKSRIFSVHMLGYLAADTLWEVPESENRIRPVMIAYFGTDQELQPFNANFRAGRPAACRHQGFVLPKSAGHRFATQKTKYATITVAYLPELFDLEPIAVDRRVTFVFAPPTWWVKEQAAGLFQRKKKVKVKLPYNKKLLQELGLTEDEVHGFLATIDNERGSDMRQGGRDAHLQGSTVTLPAGSATHGGLT